MFRRSLFRLTVLVAGLGLAASSLAVHGQDDTTKRGRKYKSPPPTARIEITVLKDVNGKPIENAAVVFHPMEGEKDKGNMELKTGEDGKTVIDVLPMGDTVRLQVIAHGFQTFGRGLQGRQDGDGDRDSHAATGCAILDLQEKNPEVVQDGKSIVIRPGRARLRRRGQAC